MAEWVKDPSTDVELWHRITGDQEMDILEMACGNLISERDATDRRSEVPVELQHPDCRETELIGGLGRL